MDRLMDAATKQHTYAFANEHALQAERLRLLAGLFDEHTTARLRATGVGPGWRCLEVGAGGAWTDGGLDAVWVHVAGELDVATMRQLERTLREPQLQARLVVLYLRELAFMDSSGVHAIVNASIRARQTGRRLVVLRGAPNVDRMLTLTGSFDDLETGDVEPPVGAFQQLAQEDLVR